jgi:hypothetical protein
VSYEKAINEIQGLLTQTGIPPGHAQDIAARLSSALSLYYDYRANGGGGDNSSTNLDNISRANSEGAAFRNRFGAPEEDRKPGLAGQAGKDGLSAWARGGTGAAGQDGQDGSSDNYNTFNDYRTVVVGGGGVDLSDLYKQLKDLAKRIKALEDEDEKPTNCLKCCKGKYKDKDPCSVLEMQANRLGNCPDNGKSFCKQLEDMEKKVKAIEKQLKDTVDC